MFCCLGPWHSLREDYLWMSFMNKISLRRATAENVKKKKVLRCPENIYFCLCTWKSTFSMQKSHFGIFQLCLETKEGISFYQIDELKWPPNKIDSQCHTKKKTSKNIYSEKARFWVFIIIFSSKFFLHLSIRIQRYYSKGGKTCCRCYCCVIVVAPKDP